MIGRRGREDISRKRRIMRNDNVPKGNPQRKLKKKVSFGNIQTSNQELQMSGTEKDLKEEVGESEVFEESNNFRKKEKPSEEKGDTKSKKKKSRPKRQRLQHFHSEPMSVFYSKSSVFKVLQEGMVEIGLNRPDDPVEFLGKYLLDKAKELENGEGGDGSTHNEGESKKRKGGFDLFDSPTRKLNETQDPPEQNEESDF